MLSSTAQRRSAVLPIRRGPTDEDKKIFLIGPPLRHITNARIVDFKPYPIGDPEHDRGEHWQARVLIQHKAGVAEWTPIVFFCHSSWYSISGLHRLPQYAAAPLKQALLGAVRDFIAKEQTIVVKAVPHGRPGRWQWKIPHCPVCHKPHFHSAGEGIEPALLGYRRAHCLDKDLTKLGITSRPGYLLEEAL